jgi:hypothetical protein
VLRPINVDWKLTEVADKITEILKPENGFNATSLNEYAEAIKPLYQKNLDMVRNRLLDDLSFNETTIALQLGLSSKQTPDIMDTLNNSGSVVINPLAYGLVLPDRQLTRLSNVMLTKLEFDLDGPALPETNNAIVTVKLSHRGIIRKEENLYSVYSDIPREWSSTYLPSGEIIESKPSLENEDILNFLLGEKAQEIKQKVSLPPVWSDLSINVSYSPALLKNQRPRITKLFLEFSVNALPAPENQRVLSVQSIGSMAGAVIKCSPDLAKRSDGLCPMVRIFDKGTSVHLDVFSPVAESTFDSWDIIGGKTDQVGFKQTNVNFQIDDHVIALCHWNFYQNKIQPTVVSHIIDTLALKDIAKIAESHEDENTRRELKAFLSAPPQVRDLLMRVEASENASVTGLIPTLSDADILDEKMNGWKKVNYRGIVGWVNTLNTGLTEIAVEPEFETTTA